MLFSNSMNYVIDFFNGTVAKTILLETFEKLMHVSCIRIEVFIVTETYIILPLELAEN